jgi:hypothetical protein
VTRCPLQKHVKGFTKGLAQRRDPVLNAYRAYIENNPLDDPVAFESSQRRRQRLLRHSRNGTPQVVEPGRALTQHVQDAQGPLVEDLIEKLSMRCLDENRPECALEGIRWVTWSR